MWPQTRKDWEIRALCVRVLSTLPKPIRYCLGENMFSLRAELGAPPTEEDP